MRIPAVGKLITHCWVRAEEALRENVRKKFPDRDEEMITDLFHAELENEFVRVSATGAVSQAFLNDLKQAFPDLGVEELRSKIARGLIATVSFHPRHIEENTGGDLGVVIVRPDVQKAQYGWSELTIDHDYKRGLLCQAKIFRRDSRWGGLSSTQEQRLPKVVAYFALLLYRYLDQKGERRELAPFGWQLAIGATAERISAWLSSDKFPSLQTSQQILMALVRDEIGTDDDELIDKFISPPLRPSLVINIRWSLRLKCPVFMLGFDWEGLVALPGISLNARDFSQQYWQNPRL